MFNEFRRWFIGLPDETAGLVVVIVVLLVGLFIGFIMEKI